MKKYIFLSLLLSCLLHVSCKKTEGFLFFGKGISEKFVGVYHGLAEESLVFTTVGNEPALSTYRVTVEIKEASKTTLDLFITLCKTSSDGKVDIVLQADVDLDSPDKGRFTIQPENFPTTIFNDRKVAILEGEGVLDIRTENLNMNLIMTTEGTSVDPDPNLNTKATIDITTDAKGAGSPGC